MNQPFQNLVGLTTKARILFQPFLRSPHGVTRCRYLLDLKKSSQLLESYLPIAPRNVKNVLCLTPVETD